MWMPVTQGDCDNIAYSDMLGITRDSCHGRDRACHFTCHKGQEYQIDLSRIRLVTWRGLLRYQLSPTTSPPQALDRDINEVISNSELHPVWIRRHYPSWYPKAGAQQYRNYKPDHRDYLDWTEPSTNYNLARIQFLPRQAQLSGVTFN